MKRVKNKKSKTRFHRTISTIAIVCFCFLFQSSQSKEYELDYLVRNTNLFCIGEIVKADISNFNDISYTIKVEHIFYDEFNKISKNDTIQIHSYHHSYGFLELNKLFERKVFFISLNKETNKYIYNFSFELMMINDAMIAEKKLRKESQKLIVPEYHHIYMFGFIDEFSDPKLGRKKNLLPKDLIIDINYSIPHHRRFVPLRYLVDYFNEIKTIKVAKKKIKKTN